MEQVAVRNHCSSLQSNGHKQLVPRHRSHHQSATDQDETVLSNRQLLTQVPVESKGQRAKWTVQNQTLDDRFSAGRLLCSVGTLLNNRERNVSPKFLTEVFGIS